MLSRICTATKYTDRSRRCRQQFKSNRKQGPSPDVQPHDCNEDATWKHLGKSLARKFRQASAALGFVCPILSRRLSPFAETFPAILRQQRHFHRPESLAGHGAWISFMSPSCHSCSLELLHEIIDAPSLQVPGQSADRNLLSTNQADCTLRAALPASAAKVVSPEHHLSPLCASHNLRTPSQKAMPVTGTTGMLLNVVRCSRFQARNIEFLSLQRVVQAHTPVQ